MEDKQITEAWDYLVDNGIVSEQTMQVVVGINGYTMKTIDEICRHTVGMDYDQLIEEGE